MTRTGAERKATVTKENTGVNTMITDWRDLAGRTILVAAPFMNSYILFFEDGECAHIDGSGEEIHGDHWPILTDEFEKFIPNLEKPSKPELNHGGI